MEAPVWQLESRAGDTIKLQNLDGAIRSLGAHF